MRKSMFLIAAVVLLSFTAASSFSQTPSVTVFFDQSLQKRAMNCPGPVLDTLYVVARDFNAFLVAIEYKVQLPPSINHFIDFGLAPITIGTTVTGIAEAYNIPQNAFSPLVVAQMLVLWNCNACTFRNDPVRVVPHPLTGHIRATRFPDLIFLNAGGGTSWVCLKPALDIHPTSCPNPFNINLWEKADESQPMKGGKLPVAILGDPNFDVSLIDLSSVLLEGVPILTKKNGSFHASYEDVNTPPGTNPCDCSSAGPDGIMDLVMHFSRQDIANMIGAQPPVGTVITLTLTGKLLDGTPFKTDDCIRTVGKSAPIVFSNGGGANLKPIYPNPFNPVARVAFTLPENQSIRLAVYDVLGRLVEVLGEGVYSAGEHVFEWKADGMASGVYYYRLETDGKTFVQRATLLK